MQESSARHERVAQLDLPRLAEPNRFIEDWLSERQDPSFSEKSSEISALCLSKTVKTENLDVTDGGHRRRLLGYEPSEKFIFRLC